MKTPYKVLISEILLTRTKAKQVTPVYKNFMENYPTLNDFLKAELDDLKIMLKSLGLLFRAEMLKQLGFQLKNDFNGKIPNTLAELKTLKGIGDYGANAILCFGFNQKTPLLDANFIRIFSRVFGIKSKTKTPKTDNFLWSFSKELLPSTKYISYNYAILDLGGKICLSRTPKCGYCPIKKICLYYSKKIQ
ncbi:MAG: hypothetical protein ACTSV5_13895 [Promethearchaeota archaeon]